MDSKRAKTVGRWLAALGLMLILIPVSRYIIFRDPIWHVLTVMFIGLVLLVSGLIIKRKYRVSFH
jgi:hypothetical protein